MSVFISTGTASSLPEHCTPTSQSLNHFSSAFHSCVPTSLAFLSTSLGILSIIAWLFAQLPQIYKNYKLQSASGLSIYFLGEWLLGDLANLLGALLTGQASWQVVVAGYYVLVDIGLTSQYFWYTHAKTRRITDFSGRETENGGGSAGSGEVLLGVSLSDDSSAAHSLETGDGKANPVPVAMPAKAGDETSSRSTSLCTSDEKDTTISSPRMVKRRPSALISTNSQRTLLVVSVLCVALTNASPLYSPQAGISSSIPRSELAGRFLSWISTILYLVSRLPQIYKNATRHSTSGLSPTLFIAAFFGNLFYSSSLLTNPQAWESCPPYGLHGWVGPEGSDRATWIALAAPFWLGAAGVLALDATIGAQFLAYGERDEKLVVVEDREGRSRWQSVSGWMRGWVPSPSPDRKADGVDARPLLGIRESGNGGYGAT